MQGPNERLGRRDCALPGANVDVDVVVFVLLGLSRAAEEVKQLVAHLVSTLGPIWPSLPLRGLALRRVARRNLAELLEGGV